MDWYPKITSTSIFRNGSSAKKYSSGERESSVEERASGAEVDATGVQDCIWSLARGSKNQRREAYQEQWRF